MGRFRSFLSGTRVDSSPPPYFLKIRSSKFFILSTICMAVFTDIFLYGIIVPVIPFALSSRAGVPQSSVQSWVSVLLAVYGAALLVGSPLSGWYADKSSSRRMPLLFGLFALAAATIMLCLARSVALLIVGRILQGFSASIVWTVGQALLVDTVGQAEIGKTLGYVSLSMTVGTLMAPLLGGVVYDKAGYYAVYYMSFGLLVLDILLRVILIEKKIAQQWLDDEVTDPENLNPNTTPASDGGAENVEERKVEHNPAMGDTVRTLDVPVTLKVQSNWPPIFTLLKSKRLVAALWSCTVQAVLLVSFDSVIPLFVQETFHWDSIPAGLTFLAIMIPSLTAPVVGWLSDRFGPRWFCVTGFIIAIPFWVLLRFVTHDSLNQKVLLCALLALIGISLTLVMPPLMAEITYIIEAKEKQSPGRFGKNGAYAQAYGLLITAFAAGTLIGPVWSGYVKEAAGWGTMAWSLGLFSLSGAIPCLIYTGGLITENNARTAAQRAINAPPAAESHEESVTV